MRARGAADGNPGGCGYATTIVIYSDNVNFPTPGWYSGPVSYNTLLSDAAHCQTLCAAHPRCDYFSYEYEVGVRRANALTARRVARVARWC